MIDKDQKAAWERLAFAIIEQAVSDYRLLARAGWVREGKMNPEKPMPRKRCGLEPCEARALVRFIFHPKGRMQGLLRDVGSNIDAEAIRAKLRRDIEHPRTEKVSQSRCKRSWGRLTPAKPVYA